MRILILFGLISLVSCANEPKELKVYDIGFEMDNIDFTQEGNTSITTKEDTVMASSDIDALKSFTIKYVAIDQTNKMLANEAYNELKIYSAYIKNNLGENIIPNISQQKLDSLSKELFGLSNRVSELIELTKK